MEEWRGNVSCCKSKEKRSPWAWVGGEDLKGNGYQTTVLEKAAFSGKRGPKKVF